MKRILYIHHAGGIGGAPLSLLYLIRQLDRSRYQPVVITLKDGPVVDLYRAEGIETHVVPGEDFSHTMLEWYGGRDLWRLPGKVLSIPGTIRRLRAAIWQHRPELVHLNSSTLAPAAIAASRESVPIVWHIREPLAHGYMGLRRSWIRRTVDRCADQVVAICQNDADQLIPSDRIHVIYNFVHFDQFDRSLTGEAFRRECDIPPDTPLVTFLGGVSEPKGTLTLIRALPELTAHTPDIRILIAGHPPRPASDPGFKGLAKRLLGVNRYQKTVQRALDTLPRPARDALIFTGVRTDIPDILAASHVLVFPSTVPHFARPIIEAAAMGLPSVASDLGGPRELIVHGETGKLVEANDPAALAEALSELIANPEQARKLGEAAYQRARRLFDAGRNAQATITLYDDLLVE